MDITLGFYNVRPRYMHFLQMTDYRVQYTKSKNYRRKHFLGPLRFGDEEYFIPLSSPKEHKHLSWDYVGEVDFVLHETITPDELRPNDVIKEHYPDGSMEKILSVLNINNMIPVPAECRRQLTIPTEHYSLLRKEYEFCSGIQSQIIEKAVKIYTDQTERGIFDKRCCNFKRLERAKQYFHLQ